MLCESVRSYWCTQDWKAPLSRSEGIWGATAALTRRICVTLGNSWQLIFQALPTPPFSFCPCSLSRTAGPNNPQAAVIWSAMSLANLLGSKRGLVLSALLVCAVIFEIGKWLAYFALLRSSVDTWEVNAQRLIKVPQTNILQRCITCSVLCTADCQKGSHKQRSTAARIKTKLEKFPDKRSKPQNKATPAAPTQTLLTQVQIYRYTLNFKPSFYLYLSVIWRW